MGKLKEENNSHGGFVEVATAIDFLVPGAVNSVQAINLLVIDNLENHSQAYALKVAGTYVRKPSGFRVKAVIMPCDSIFWNETTAYWTPKNTCETKKVRREVSEGLEGIELRILGKPRELSKKR